MSLPTKGGNSKVLSPTPYDMQMMLACEVHKGTKNLDKKMEKYVYGRRSSDGTVLIFFNYFNNPH